MTTFHVPCSYKGRVNISQGSSGQSTHIAILLVDHECQRRETGFYLTSYFAHN